MDRAGRRDADSPITPARAIVRGRPVLAVLEAEEVEVEVEEVEVEEMALRSELVRVALAAPAAT